MAPKHDHVRSVFQRIPSIWPLSQTRRTDRLPVLDRQPKHFDLNIGLKGE